MHIRRLHLPEPASDRLFPYIDFPASSPYRAEHVDDELFHYEVHFPSLFTDRGGIFLVPNLLQRLLTFDGNPDMI
jgi:hypothetical protein